ESEWSVARRLSTQIRRGKRLSSALRARRTRVCAFGSWHPPNVAATVLCRQYLVGTCVGTRSYFSWRAARHGAPIDHPKRRAAHNSRNRRVDCCDLHYFCHTLVLQGQVISTNRLTPYRPYRHATVSERCLFYPSGHLPSRLECPLRAKGRGSAAVRASQTVYLKRLQGMIIHRGHGDCDGYTSALRPDY